MSKLFAKHRQKMRQKSARGKDTEVASADQKNISSNQSVGLNEPSDNGPHIRISALSHEGRGVGRKKGKIQFVDNALPGELVSVELEAHRASFDEYVARTVIEASPHRVEPICQYYGECGGCSLQHLSLPKQLEHKQQVLFEHLDNQGVSMPEEVLAPIESGGLHYRSRTRLSCDLRQRNHPLIGYRKRNSKALVGIANCPVLAESITRIDKLEKIVSFFCESTQRAKQLGHIELLDNNGRAVAVIRLNKGLSDEELHAMRLLVEGADLEVFLSGPQNEFYGLSGNTNADEMLSYELNLPELGDLRGARISLAYLPVDFTQVNRGVNQAMVERALALLSPQSNEHVLDLFCGLGNFTLPIAAYCEQVTGVEGSEEMVARTKANASFNTFKNIECYAANLFANLDELSTSQPWAKKQYDKILLDPPRAGAKELVRDIARFKASRIVYISCNPATLARDCAELEKQGYRLSKAGVIDMFPHTSHVESIAVFDR